MLSHINNYYVKINDHYIRSINKFSPSNKELQVLLHSGQPVLESVTCRHSTWHLLANSANESALHIGGEVVVASLERAVGASPPGVRSRNLVLCGETMTAKERPARRTAYK